MWRPGLAVAFGAAAIVLIIGALFVLAGPFGGGDPSPVITEPPEVVTPVPGVPPGAEGMETSAGSVWVWSADEIWRYTDGAWSAYASLPSADRWDPWDVEYVGDTRWMLNEFGVFSFDGVDWVELATAPEDTWRLDGDPASGILWLSTGDNLYRWDGEEMTNVGHPPTEDGWVGDIIVTADGNVWASGLLAWTPWDGGLARYDDTTSSWEVIRPGGGAEDAPAGAFTTTPDGGLWVMLADWFEDWDEREAAGEPTAVIALAHRNGATGAWTVYDDDLALGYALAMAADDDAVWLAHAGGGVAGFEGTVGVVRFDGRTWTNYLEDTPDGDPIEDIAVAPDGTIWYILNGVLYQLEP